MEDEHIDAQRGEGRGGGTSCTPSKYLEKLDLKKAIKHENTCRGSP
jgi:hypothetical protein